ncbi:MAG TPA: GNAT family N-acetyltransferase [Dehalococcoidia bacterium]|nr:GNAT family N-acetyltransferase [Dehalococcoidia bacterium]
MDYRSRPYSDPADIDAMKSVLIAGRRASRHSGYRHIGDLDWALFYDPDRKPREAVIRLWCDAQGRTAGWGRMQGSVYFEEQVLPELRGSALEQEVIEWCVNAVRSTGAEPLGGAVCATEIFEDDDSTIDLLRRRGFTDTRVSGLYFSKELRPRDPSPTMPGGFVVRGMREADVEQRAAVHFAAFSPGSRMTADAYRAFMHAPGYDPDLDSVVEAPDGRLAAYAMGWLDAANGIGEFEPVGAHPEFRRMGLARAALHRGMSKMGERGMTTAIVYTNAENAAARALYPSAGFSLVNRFVTLSKA